MTFSVPQIVSEVEPIHLLTDAVIPKQILTAGLLEQLPEPVWLKYWAELHLQSFS